MARPWQYKFELYARSEIVERYGSLPEKVQLDEDAPEGYGWPDLSGVALPEGYDVLLDGVLTRVINGSPDKPSWDNDEKHRLWGTPKRDMGDSFSVWLEDGKPEGVGGMFDLTNLNVAFVQLVLSLAQRADQVLVYINSLDVVEPTPGALAGSIRSSVSERWRGNTAERVEQINVAVQMPKQSI